MKKIIKLKDTREDVFYGTPYFDKELKSWMKMRNFMLNNYLDRVKLALRPYSQTQLDLMKGGRSHMMKKKGMTKNQKLKLNKTAAAKKKVKATKK